MFSMSIFAAAFKALLIRRFFLAGTLGPRGFVAADKICGIVTRVGSLTLRDKRYTVLVRTLG